MNDSGFSVSKILRIFGALLLDAVLIIVFIKKFFWFTVTMPAGESLFMMLILLIGLAAVDVVIIGLPLSKKVGIAYSAAISFLLVLYAIVANLVSILTRIPLLLVPSKIIWYGVWQLLILAAFILAFALVAAFAKRNARDYDARQAEVAARGNVMMMLSDMQVVLGAHESDPAFATVTAAFKAMRERINASTPFGRILGNPAVADLENRIMGNLNLLQNELRAGLTGQNAAKLQGIMEDTHRMIINRETLNIQ